jgi:hydroxymethylglutaryl-CoA lyase
MPGMFPSPSERVQIVEVGPRDGLQDEPDVVSVAARRGLVERLFAAGLGVVEVGSFVRPDLVPQLANTEDMIRDLKAPQGAMVQALTPNLIGLRRALGTPVNRIAVFISASERHNRANINRSIQDSLVIAGEVLARASDEGLRRRGYLSMAWGSVDEPEMPVAKVVGLAKALHDAGCEEVALGDTVGYAVPPRVREVLRAVRDEVPVNALALHMHDTRGTALANVMAGLEEGVRIFDTAVGGLGGCPFAPGAPGNLATENLVLMLAAMGLETGVDLDALAEAAHYVEALLARPLMSHGLRVLRGPYRGEVHP